MQLLSKGLRAIQLYLPNNPVYQRAVENIRTGFRQIWQATDDLALDIGETDMRWEDHVVYQQEQRNESIAWTLFKDGVRSVSFKPGVEEDEIVRLLATLHKARTIQADAADDLLTLLWSEDFQHIAYTFRELTSENAAPIEPGHDIPQVSASDVSKGVRDEAPPRPEGMVKLEDFDTTLYFLDEKEIEYLQKETEREYAQDLRRNVLSMLFDLLELQTYGTVRAELLSIVENFIPYLLGSGDFRSVAFILREARVIQQRARELIPEHRQQLESLPLRLSQAEALAQMLQALDEATIDPTEEDLADLFAELRPQALVTLMGWIPKLVNARVRYLVQTAAERLAQANTPEVLKALSSDDQATQLEMVKLAGRMKLTAAVDGMSQLFQTGDRPLKLALVEALTTIGTAGAMRLLEAGIDDGDRDVRIAAVKFLAQRGHRNAFPRIEAAVAGGKVKDADLTEKMAFFEAYGTLAGAKGIPILEKMLLGKGGLLSRKEEPETRACAAMALGRIRSPDARAILDKAVQDKEPLVRNAVSRALREVGM